MNSLVDKLNQISSLEEKDMLSFIASCSYSDLEFVGLHENILDFLILYLSNHKKFQIRQSIANNELTPLPILLSLAKDPVIFVRQAVAENSKINEEIMELMFNDTNCIENLCSNRSLTIKMIDKIIKTYKLHFLKAQYVSLISIT